MSLPVRRWRPSPTYRRSGFACRWPSRTWPESIAPRWRTSSSPRAKRLAAKPLGIVRAVDPDRHTADILYELPAVLGMNLFKDEMVTVLVPLDRAREETVVPYSAVVFDAYAGAWIYLDRTPDGAKHDTYERRRVELAASLGKDVVIRPGCKKGDRVVIDGAAELFSREFHKPPGVKSGQDLDDDD